MPDTKQVLVTGASGLIGGLVIKHLGKKYALSALNRRTVARIPCVQADVTDLEAIRPAFRDVHTVLHLAAATHELVTDWIAQMRVTAEGAVNVYRAAQEAGVKRVVFMSSGSTMCGYEWDNGSPYGALARGDYEQAVALASNALGTVTANDDRPWRLVSHLDSPRPDSPYGAAKLLGEIAGRWFADTYGMSVLCIRLGAVLDTNRPKMIRHFPGFLDQMDAVRMIEACIDAPESARFDIFDAISDNATRWRDTSHAEKVLDWKPQGSSDIFDPNEFRAAPGPHIPKWRRVRG